MKSEYCVARLESNLEIFRGSLSAVERPQAQWKPAPDKWSLLEVINHLADEEVEDFRTRLQLLIENPNQDWPPIDPPRWALERRYQDRELQESIGRFERARRDSLSWLKGLPRIDWQTARLHPNFGMLRAGDLLHSWLAHDLIHIRQMNRLNYEYLSSQTDGYSISYAGNW